MKCPACGANQDVVLTSRLRASGSIVWRRRVCAACGKRFTTHETIEPIHEEPLPAPAVREDVNAPVVHRRV